MVNSARKITPNEKQQECIVALNGPVMVLAGPGTGKTFTIIQRIKYMIEQKIDPSSILCLTYSEAAANEMKARLVKDIGTVASAVCVNTYHSFCNEIIKQYPSEFELLEGVGLVDDITKRNIMKDVVAELKPVNYQTKWGDIYYYIPDHIKSVEVIKAARITKDEYYNVLNSHPEWQGKMDELEIEYKEREQKGKLVKTFLSKYESQIKKIEKAKETWQIFELYDKKLKENNFIDFNDMINMVLNVFEANYDFLKRVSSKYKYFLVDEYQDTNYSQNSIVFNLAKGAESNNIFVVGDDDQIIYEFQGAKTDTLEKFLLQYPDTKVICLNENNRSTQNILDFSYSVISQDKTRLEYNQNFKKYNISKVLTAKNPEIIVKNKPIQIHGFADLKQENNFIVNSVAEIINSGELPLNKNGEKDLSKIAILARENNELKAFASLLEAKNIKYQIKESKNIFDIKSSLVLYFYLKTLLNHELFADKMFGLLLTEPFMFDCSDYNFLLKQNRLNHKDLITNIKTNINDYNWANKERVLSFIKTFDELSKLKSSLNIKDLIVNVINKTGILNYFLNNNIQKSENIYALKKFVDEAQSLLKLKKSVWLGSFLEHLDTAFESNIPINIDKEDYTLNAIQLVTLHGSKGREFEHVFIPNLIAKKWENKQVKNTHTLPVDKNFEEVDEEQARRSEQLRLLFVGITRSKYDLILSYSNAIDGSAQELTQYLEAPLQNSKIIQTFNHELTKDEYLGEIAAGMQIVPFDYAATFKDEIKARLENFTLSPSSLNSYIKCPRNFLYSQVLNIPVFEKSSENAIYGSAVHKTLQMSVQYAKEKGVYPTAEECCEYFVKCLDTEEFESKEDRDKFETRGKKCFTAYHKHLVDTPVERIFATEFRFDFVPYKNKFLKGFIDRIEQNSDLSFEFYDYKTGAAKPKTQIADGKDYENYLNQLRFYKYAFELQNPNKFVTRAGLLFVEEPDKNFYVNLNDEDSKIIEEKIGFVYENLEKLNFNPLPKDNRKCDFCEYYHLCKLNDM